ncbi:MAG TPA: SgcJ/EcaC family oxidoreductase [Propionibacteriaceae bacterium]|nr:SgcJ/EcaC family oxidoreductase [Propionibacteriaceae bacterium]
MTRDDADIRALVKRWAAAVHSGDLDTVLDDHSSDIVMFDVPPPYQGVRGIDAYRKTWPSFFTWQAQGGVVFEIESMDVTAGDDVAFVWALLRCGAPEEFSKNPDMRLRLTLGLRKHGKRWVVTHEHHSFPDTSAADTSPNKTSFAGEAGAETNDEKELRDIHERWFAATEAKDIDGLMTHIADDVVSYEHDVPLQHLGVANVRKVCQRGLDSAPGTITWQVPDMTVLVRDDIAVAWGLNHMTAEQADGQVAESWSRGTRLFQRQPEGWRMIHQHVSYPYDPETGAAVVDLKP